MILVLGVFAVCALVIMSLVGVDTKSNKYSTGFSEMDEINSKINKYEFYIDTGMSKAEARDLVGAKTDSEGKGYISVEGKGFIVKYYLDK